MLRFLPTALIMAQVRLISGNCESEIYYIQNCISPVSECYNCLPCWNAGKVYVEPATNRLVDCRAASSVCKSCSTQCNANIKQGTCPNALVVKSRLHSPPPFTLSPGSSSTQEVSLSCPTNQTIHILWALYHEANLLSKPCDKSIAGEFATVCNDQQSCVYNVSIDRACPSAFVYTFGYYCTPNPNGDFPPVHVRAATITNAWHDQTQARVFIAVAFFGGLPVWCAAMWFLLKLCPSDGGKKGGYPGCCNDFYSPARTIEDEADDTEMHAMKHQQQHENAGGVYTGAEGRNSQSLLVDSPPQGVGFENKVQIPSEYWNRQSRQVGVFVGDVPTNDSIPKEEQSVSLLVDPNSPHVGESMYELPHMNRSVAANSHIQMPYTGTQTMVYSGMHPSVHVPRGPSMLVPSAGNPPVAEETLVDGVEKIEKADLQFTQVIGQGSYGKVFRARWRGITVAAKKFHRDNVDEEKVGDFIRHEIELSKKASGDENVLTVFGYCQDPFCLVTELMDGSVKKYLDSQRGDGRKASVLERAEIALQAAKGINHLHSLSIVHRDIAARNILMSNKGSRDSKIHVVVSDFGMSRIMNQEAYAQTYSAVGPLKWMAPEAIKEQKFSSKSDTFAFGITLWEIMTGQDPYPDIDAVNTAVEVLVRKRRPKIHPNIPHALANLMQRCWESEPEDRPEFPEIIDALQSFIEAGHA